MKRKGHRANADGASVDVVMKFGQPCIELIRGANFAPEILTRDEAAALVEDSWGVQRAIGCDGECWVCLLDEVVTEDFL